MHDKQQIGKTAEQTAYHFLQSKGLHLLKENYRCFYGEIDLIMQDGNDIVFVEVRSRNRLEYGSAIESINKNKQKKLIKTALYFLQKQQWLDKVACRFDVIGISSVLGKMNMEWIKNAFSVEN